MAELDRRADHDHQQHEEHSAHEAHGGEAHGSPRALGAAGDAAVSRMAGGGGGGADGGRADGGRGGGSEREIAESGFRGTPVALPHLERLEKSFGQGLSHVRAYLGGPAAAAAEKLGADAYAVGHKVAFKSTSPSLDVVAHEVAHVVQQSGGSKAGAAAKGGAAGAAKAGGSHEQEADEAAAEVLSGGQAHVKAAPEQVQRWAGGDHYAIGNLAGEKALNRFKAMFPNVDPAKAGLHTKQNEVLTQAQPGGKAMKSQQAETLAVETSGKGGISMGAASELSGDHLVTPDKLQGQTEEHDPDPSKGVKKAAGLLHVDPDKMNQGFATAAMAMAAATNANHFFPLNREEWSGHHAKAQANAAGGDIDGAMMEEGFAGHFLQDTHASGHMAPRGLDGVEHLHNAAKGGALEHVWQKAVGAKDAARDGAMGLTRSKQWHDFFCMMPDGLPTSQGWFHGDDFMDGNDLEHVSDIVADSLLETLAASQGKKVEMGVRARVPVPDVPKILAHPVAGPAWRIMQGEYAADLKQAEHDIKDGDKGVTDGGTTFDSKAALAEMEKYFIAGPTAVPKGADTLSGAADGVEQGRKTVGGVASSLKSYLSRNFDDNPDLDAAQGKAADQKPGEERWDPLELEDRFHVFSDLEKSAGDYKSAIDAYRAQLAKAQGLDAGTVAKATADLDKEAGIATKLEQQAADWKRQMTALKSGVGGFLGGLEAKVGHEDGKRTAFRQQVLAALDPSLAALLGLTTLPRGGAGPGAKPTQKTPGGMTPKAVENT